MTITSDVTEAPTRSRPAWRPAVAMATALYGCFLAFVLFEPSNNVPSKSIAFISRNLAESGLPRVLSGFAYVDFWCNIAIMVPLAAGVVLLWPGVRWERWVVLAFALSAGVETTQALLFPHRVPAFSDVVANTFGVLLGSGLAAFAWWVGHRGPKGSAGNR